MKCRKNNGDKRKRMQPNLTYSLQLVNVNNRNVFMSVHVVFVSFLEYSLPS